MTDLVVMAEDAAPVKVNSHQIKLGIRASLAQGYQTFFEVGNDTGTRVTRHADAVAIGIWPSTGHQVHGFEVKVSRTDFLNEMKDPSKSQAIFRFCHRWSLATPPGLVRVDELPPNWGLVTFDGKSLRTVRAAPLLAPEPMTAGFVAALVRRAGEIDAGLLAEAEAKGKKAAEDVFKANVERSRRDVTERSTAEAKEAIEFQNKMKEALGTDFLVAWNVPDLALAYRFVTKAQMGGRWNSVAEVVGRLEGAAETIRKALIDVGVEPPPQAKRKRA